MVFDFLFRFVFCVVGGFRTLMVIPSSRTIRVCRVPGGGPPVVEEGPLSVPVSPEEGPASQPETPSHSPYTGSLPWPIPRSFGKSRVQEYSTSASTRFTGVCARGSVCVCVYPSGCAADGGATCECETHTSAWTPDPVSPAGPRTSVFHRHKPTRPVADD